MSEEETDYGILPKMADVLAEYEKFHKTARCWPLEYRIPSLTEWMKSITDPSAKSDMVLVPRKPTKAMLRAAEKAMSPGKRPTQDWMTNRQKHAYRYEMMIKAYLEETNE